MKLVDIISKDSSNNNDKGFINSNGNIFIFKVYNYIINVNLHACSNNIFIKG